MSPSNSKTSVVGWACLGGLLLLSSGRAQAESRHKASADACLADPICSGFYEEARRLSKAGDLQAAVVAYQAAYRRQPAAWLLINLGRTLHKLGRPQEALAQYQRYSTAEPNGPADRQQMVREYTVQAEKAIAEKSALEKPTLEISVDHSAAPADEPAPLPLAVVPPVVAPAVAPAVVPMGTLRVESPPARKELALPAYFWAGLGVGGALLVGGAVTGGLALSQSASLQATTYAGPASAALTDQQSRIRALAATTDALLVVGGVTLGAVTVAALVQRFRSRGVRPAATALGVGPGGLFGRF